MTLRTTVCSLLYIALSIFHLIGPILFNLSFNLILILRSSPDWAAGWSRSAWLEAHPHPVDLERPWRDRGAGQVLLGRRGHFEICFGY